MKISIAWLAVLLFITLFASIAWCSPLGLTVATINEGFATGTGDLDLRITTCPVSTVSFVDKDSGKTLCCDGTIVNDSCNGKVLCTISPSTGNDIPTCSAYTTALFEEKGRVRCPAFMPNYFEDTTTGAKGCCEGRRKPDGTAPASGSQPMCRLYSTEKEERIRPDSCYNISQQPKYWPLSKFQEMFSAGGCSRKLAEGDPWWWRTQSKEVVEQDMKAWAWISPCRGVDWQNPFCHPDGRCEQPKNWPLSRFQALWDKTGCSRRLGEGDQAWWKTQSKETVEADILKGWAAVSNCRGNDGQNAFCHGAGFCDNPSAWQFYGAWIGTPNLKALAIRTLGDGAKVYITEESPYTKMVSSRGVGKYYVGKASQFDPARWDSYYTAPTGVYNIKRS